MGKYIINGGCYLRGEVFISGAKNSVLPILAATILNSGISVLKNVPMLTDTFVSIDILKYLGCDVKIDKNTLIVDTTNINKTFIPNELVKKMRSSIIFLGSLLGRFKEAHISYPGGCKLGKRPINFHLQAFKNLNIDITEENNLINATTNEIIGTEINLPFPSVGATQNIILATVCSKGITILNGPAKEPEIIDLQNFLNKMGANVEGAGTDKIIITGVDKLSTTLEHTIIPDRIEAGTFLCSAAITGSKLKLNNVIPSHLTSLTEILEKMGCIIDENSNSLVINAPKNLKSVDKIETAPYPLFPTDLQPQLMSVLTLANGTSIIEEKIFESRNKHILELNKMQANISGSETKFIVNGVSKLSPTTVFSKDLRGGAGLIIAALATQGQTIVEGAKYVKRGYEHIEKKLSNIGANIKYIDD